ncbi:MAG: hypothetical protein LBJ35_00535 [Spirochaetaceae bacterium]|nr:hypothetical protein [Spirochaetaceae bacterium]
MQKKLDGAIYINFIEILSKKEAIRPASASALVDKRRVRKRRVYFVNAVT